MRVGIFNNMFANYFLSNELYFDCNLMFHLFFDAIDGSICNDYDVSTGWETSLVLL